MSNPALRDALQHLTPLIWHTGEADLRVTLEAIYGDRVDRLVEIREDWDAFLGDTRNKKVFHFIQDPTPEQEEAILKYCQNQEEALRCHFSEGADDIFDYTTQGYYGVRNIRVCLVASSKSPQNPELLKFLLPTGEPTVWLDYDAPLKQALNTKILEEEIRPSISDSSFFDPSIKLRPTQSVLMGKAIIVIAMMAARKRLKEERGDKYTGLDWKVAQEDYDRAVQSWTELRESRGLTAGLG